MTVARGVSMCCSVYFKQGVQGAAGGRCCGGGRALRGHWATGSAWSRASWSDDGGRGRWVRGWMYRARPKGSRGCIVASSRPRVVARRVPRNDNNEIPQFLLTIRKNSALSVFGCRVRPDHDLEHGSGPEPAWAGGIRPPGLGRGAGRVFGGGVHRACSRRRAPLRQGA